MISPLRKITFGLLGCLITVVAHSEQVTRFKVVAPENPLFICQGQSQTLTLLATEGDQFGVVEWLKNGTYFRSGNSLILDRWQSGDFTARVIYGADTIISNNKVEVNKFTVETASGYNSRVCFGEFTILRVPELPSSTFQWTEVDLNGGTVYGTESTFKTATDGNIWCKITHNGCTKYAKHRVVNPQTCPKYTIQVPSNPHFICPQPGFDTLRINFEDELGLDSVQWFLNNELIETTSDIKFVASRWTQGDLSAKMWYLRTNLEVPKVEINKFSLNSTNGTARICPNETIRLTAPSLPAQAYYRWYQGGALGSSQTVHEGYGDSILITSYIGNVFCMITMNGCQKFDKFRVLPKNSGCSAQPVSNKTDENTEEDEMQTLSVDKGEFDVDVYPNPTNGPVSVIVSGMVEDEYVVLNITDLNGRLVLQRQFVANAAIEQMSISEPLASGMYAISVQQGNNFRVSKLAVR